MIHTDGFVTTAYKKHVCEDAIAIRPNAVCIADGCSSSQLTDVGSRLLVNAAATLVDTADSADIGSHSIAKAAAAASILGLAETSALDATLAVLRVHPVDDRFIEWKLFGDGVAMVWTPEMELENIWSISYPKNAPFYLSYTLQRDGPSDYMRFLEGVDNLIVSQNGNPYSHPVAIPVGRAFDRTVNGMIVIASDGIESFQRPDGTYVSIEEIADKIGQLHGTAGHFMYRRIARIVKEYAKEGIFNRDDLSVGAMVIDPLLDHPEHS